MQAVQLEKSINNSDWVNSDSDLIDVNDLPDIPGYHVLVQPVIVKEKTKGGIIIPEKLKEDISYLTTVGRVLKLGDLAYKDKDKFPLGEWCATGDYVCYGKFTGQKFVYKGVKLILLFDDQIIMRVESPHTLDPTFNLSN